MNRFVTWLLCFAAVFTTAERAAADGLMRDGLGAISAGRGGTNIAHFDNGAVLLDNPAAMVNIRGRGLTEMSIDTVLADVSYWDTDNASGVDVEPTLYPLPHVSMISKSDDGVWAFGGGVFAPAGFGAKYDMHPVANPAETYRYRSFGAFGKALAGLSCRVTENLALGGTMGLAVNHTELDLPGTELRANGLAFIWSLGLQYELSERTMLGLSYNSESRFDLNGTAGIDVPGLGHSRYDLDMDLVWPESFGGGIRHELSKRQTVSADVIWYNWSDAFDSVSMHMKNPNNPDFFIPLPVINDQLTLNWRDSVSLRLGYEQELSSSSVLRTGYVYHRNPVPASTLTPMIPGILEHAFSSGYGYRWADRRLDIAYQYSFGRKRTSGASGAFGGDFDNARVEASAHWLFLTFQQQF